MERLVLLLWHACSFPHIPNSPAVLKIRVKRRLIQAFFSSCCFPFPSMTSLLLCVALLDLHLALTSWEQRGHAYFGLGLLMSILVSSLLWIVMKVYLWIMAQNKASLYFTSLVSDELYNTQGIEGGQHNLISSWYLKCNHSQMGIRHYLSLWRLNMEIIFLAIFSGTHYILRLWSKELLRIISTSWKVLYERAFAHYILFCLLP